MSGQFMMDSESQLKEAIQKMIEPAGSKGAPDSPPVTDSLDGQNAPPAVPPSWRAAADSEPAHYVCPMPEHANILYDHSGKCPICGMTLIPADSPTSKKAAPEGK
jgi:hypothetical protein